MERLLKSRNILSCRSSLVFHKRSGRNIILQPRTESERTWVAKLDSLSSTQSGEITAYRRLCGLSLTLPPVYMNDELHLCVFKTDPSDTTLDQCVSKDPKYALSHLMSLVPKILDMTSVDCEGLRTGFDHLLDWPYPRLSQIYDCGEAVIEAIKAVQYSGLHLEISKLKILPNVFCHGDIKLDNILIRDGNAYLIDYELCSSSYLYRDIASIAGCTVFIATLFQKSKTYKSAQIFDFSDAFEAMECIYKTTNAYFMNIFDKKYVSRGYYYRAISHFIINRTISEVMQRGSFAEIDRLNIDVADFLIRRYGAFDREENEA